MYIYTFYDFLTGLDCLDKSFYGSMNLQYAYVIKRFRIFLFLYKTEILFLSILYKYVYMGTYRKEKIWHIFGVIVFV